MRVNLLILLAFLAGPPAHADEALARLRRARADLLNHRLPLQVGGRMRPDSVGAYDILSVRVAFDLPPNGAILPPGGTVRMGLQVRGAALNTLTLLSFFFIPTAVSRVGGGPLRHVRDPESGEVRITLDRPVEAGQPFALDIEGTYADYCLDPSGCIESGELRHLVEYGWYPLSAEFPLEDRFDIELEIRAPADLTPAATGARDAPERAGGDLIWRSRTERPATLAAFAGGPFMLRPVDGRVEVYVPPNNVDEGQQLGTVAADVVAFYGSLLGRFPFSRLGLAPISDEAGVGLGPQALVLLPEFFWTVRPDQEEATLMREVLSHEIGHQYFFNLLGVVDAAEGWMSEAFAEYAAMRFSEQVTNTLDHGRLNYWEYLLVADEQRDVPLNSEALNVADLDVRVAVLYSKGSALLQQLRQAIPNFDAVLRGYITRFAGEIVTTRDFQRYLEADSGLDQERFFAQWVRRAGHPRLQVRVVRPRDGAQQVEVQITQLPGRFGAFSGEVPLRGFMADGAITDATVSIDAPSQRVPLGLAQGLALDPGLSIFRRILPEPASDVNLSGVVDGMDLLDAWAAQGRSTPTPAWDDAVDVNRDQSIDRTDLLGIMEQFGQGW